MRHARRMLHASILALVMLASIAASAHAASIGNAPGIKNAGFEDGLDNWVARHFAMQEVPVDPEDPDGPTVTTGAWQGATCDADQRSGVVPTGVCVIDGADSFSVTDDDWAGCDEEDPECVPEPGTSTITVRPNEGSRMVRLGGPFPNADATQQHDEVLLLRQSFIVPHGATKVPLTYNVHTWDYEGFDQLRLEIRLVDAETGELIGEHEQGSFGPSGDTTLKTTGWLSAGLDLQGFEGREVFLTIKASGTLDELYGFWVYVDSGVAPERPEKDFDIEVPDVPGTDEPLDIDEFVDPLTGSTWFTMPSSDADLFDDPATPDVECAPLTIGTELPGSPATAMSNVELIVEPTDDDLDAIRHAMTGPGGGSGPGVWSASNVCAMDADLFVTYTATEGGMSETFIVPIGGMALIDPQGVVYDTAAYAASKAQGASDVAAREAAKIVGATVRLQRLVDGEWQYVLSADPGISPHVNPQSTDEHGLYRWDTSAGTYRVLVEVPGYYKATSRAVTVPPEVTDLHVGMTKIPAPKPPTTTTTKPNDDRTPVPPAPTSPKPDADPDPTATRNADTLAGSNLADLIRGLAGDDLIRGLGGHDRLFGDDGNDRLFGGPGKDELNGGAGRDTLDGSAGNDTIIGGTGADLIDAGAGGDRINVRDGKRGDDVHCGTGKDHVLADAGDRVSKDCETVKRR